MNIKFIEFILIWLLFGHTKYLVAQNQNTFENPIDNKKEILQREDIKELFNYVYAYHPSVRFQNMRYELDSIINSTSLPPDPISITERVAICKQLLDTFTFYDPHVTISPKILPKEGAVLSRYSIFPWPFQLKLINDSLIVSYSAVRNIKEGDLILSIDGISSNEYLKSSYKPRYNVTSLQVYYNLDFKHTYNVRLLRQEKALNVEVKALPSSKLVKKTNLFRTCIYNNYSCGFIKYASFNNNIEFISKLQKLGEKLIRKGFNNIIIDLRGNSGGNGEDFDKLFSLFSNNDSINYLYSHKVKISDETIKMWNLQDTTLGQVIELPKEDVVNSFPLHRGLYMGDFNYYVLVSNYTASMAASFANMMQYNKLGLLVGEPLKNNALMYGEVINKGNEFANISISTAEMGEYTMARNGILKPDIIIPYVAKEYMRGGDPVLEKLLLKIGGQK